MIRNLSVWAAGVLWLASVLAGFGAWMRYEAEPGRVGEAPLATPTDATTGWRLTAYLHPHCPCSRATSQQVAAVADGCPEVSVRVVVVRPPNTPDGWERGELWTQAGQLPRVTAVCDRDGAEARSAGAETSGEVSLTDPTGRCVFRGGMTSGRGRAGESAGRRAVLAWVRGEPAAASAPVYGCPLHTPNE